MKFGPNKVRHCYTTTYHSRNALKNKHKTKWLLSTDGEFMLFNRADEHEHCPCVELSAADKLDYCWMNDPFDGLVSFIYDETEKLVELGENGERFAFFPKVVNITDDWHGYPITSEKIGRKLLKYWKEMDLITTIDYQRALRRTL